MKTTTLLAAIVMFGLTAPALAQQTSPQAAPPAAPATSSQKVGEVAGQLLNKLTAPSTAAAPSAAPVAAPSAKSVSAPAKIAAVNINKASPAELDALPSIGEARSKAIIAGRPYKSVQELLDRKILPKDSFETIKDKVAVK